MKGALVLISGVLIGGTPGNTANIQRKNKWVARLFALVMQCSNYSFVRIVLLAKPPFISSLRINITHAYKTNQSVGCRFNKKTKL